MQLEPGAYTFGPSGGNLFVKTGRAGAAFLVGKNLTIEVTDWEGKLNVGQDPSDTRVELTVDGGSLQVTDGEGGPVTLTDLDKKSLSKAVTEQVLDGAEIKFHSDTARPSDDGSCIHVAGELQMFEENTSIEFELTIEQEEEEPEDEAKEEEGDEAEEDESSRGDDSEEDNGSEEQESSKEGDGEAADDETSDPSPEQRISGRAVFKQTEVGLEPHSTLFGLLRVRDEVEITFESKLEK